MLKSNSSTTLHSAMNKDKRQFDSERRQCLFLLLGSFMALPAASINLNEPLPAGGASLTFNILYQGKKVGEHVVNAKEIDGLIQFTHAREVAVKVLFISAFSEKHEAIEIWDKNVRLQKLEGHTIRNGERIELYGSSTDDGFSINIGDQVAQLPSTVTTIDSFWVANAIRHPTAIDVAAGEIVELTIKHTNENGYHMEADNLRADLRYDGDFLKTAVITQDGNTATYQRI